MEPPSPLTPKRKASRTNTPWSAAEEQKLKQMREAGHSWSEIAKVWRALMYTVIQALTLVFPELSFEDRRKREEALV